MKKLSIKTIFESALNEERGDNYFKALMTTKPEVLTSLAQDKDVDVRLAVLKNPIVTPLILQTMSRDENDMVRSFVAGNSKAPHEVVVQLSKDKSSVVRGAVAQNPNAPPEALIELSKDKDKIIRYFVAGHPNTPKEVLNQLTSDKYKDVSKKAKQRIFESLVSENEDEHQNALNSNYLKSIRKSKDVQLLKKLSRHDNPSVRSMVAQNPLTPVNVLINLFNTSKESDDIDAAVISNPSVGEDFLRHVIKNGTPLQQREAQFHLDRLPKAKKNIF